MMTLPSEADAAGRKIVSDGCPRGIAHVRTRVRNS
jgi:hypothetical protein